MDRLIETQLERRKAYSQKKQRGRKRILLMIIVVLLKEALDIYDLALLLSTSVIV